MSASHNRRAWDEMAAKGQRFTRAAGDDDFANPLATVDKVGWLGGDIRGKKLLCLAAGGGKHGPLYAAAGAIVTVVDISPAQLELDREVAAERRLELKTVAASMDDLSMFTAGEFDIVIQPVSTCYLPEIAPIYREVARITRSGGTYISQHKSPMSLQADIQPSGHGYELVEPYYRSGPLPPVVGSPHREEGTLEYLHRWEEILGFMCRAGFLIEDLIEPLHAKPDAAPGTFAHRSRYVAPYVRIKARRTATVATNNAAKALWTP
ncbi:MAG TPA: class I SAM-dependent methyltransferase [Pirellulaceae bacterium]|nr:class I SAM-dependent methyltransferase [Pirellulaceae bacterium]